MVKAQAAIAHTFTTAEANAGKTPDRTNPQRVVLVVVVLIAIIQILVPRVVRVVLTRTPVIVASKPANHTPHREVLTTPRYLDAALINTKHQRPESDCWMLAVSLSLFPNAYCSLPTAVTARTPAFTLALRQPVICLPILSITTARSACFPTLINFISVANRTCSRSNSKSGVCQGFWTNSGLIFSGFRPPSGWPEILGVSHWV